MRRQLPWNVGANLRGARGITGLGGGRHLPEPGCAELVSIVIPTYNRGYIVGQAIESVLAQHTITWNLRV